MHTLLLADQNATIQRVVELTFATEDVRVVVVSDGDQAIERLEAAPPDIVLADTGMPGRSGYEVARYVKQSPRLSHIPVLLLAGAFESIDQRLAKETGCDGVLAKPFEPQLVVSRVQELLARTPGVSATIEQQMFSNPLTAAHTGIPTAPDRDATSLFSPFIVSDRSDTKDTNPLESIGIPQQNDRKSDLTARVGQLDEYFNGLDAAFSTRLNAAVQSMQTVDEGGSPHSLEPQAEAGAADETPDVAVAAPPLQSPAAGGSAVLPTLADAFAALLAEERRENVPNRVESAAVENDQIVEQVTSRVLAELSTTVVRQMIADLVTETAERLVREEIERIKAAVK